MKPDSRALRQTKMPPRRFALRACRLGYAILDVGLPGPERLKQ